VTTSPVTTSPVISIGRLAGIAPLALAMAWGLAAGAGSAGVARSWNVALSPNSAAIPGSGISDAAANNGIYISEFSDRTGTGAYVYEFVEFSYDGEPE
jgi:hypothetical protein